MQIIEINKPNEIKSKKFQVKLRNLLLTNKTSEVYLKMNYVCNDSLLSETLDEFRKLKNRIAFEIR